VNPSLRRWVPYIFVLFVVFYVGVFLWGSHNDAFIFAARAIRNSPDVRRRVGAVHQVRLNFWGGYSYKFVDDSVRATFSDHVTGSNGSVTVRIEVQKHNGVWTVNKATIGGQAVSID
jgi:hypothetical protein